MARPPNYNQERQDRDRAKAAKKAEKAEKLAAKSAAKERNAGTGDAEATGESGD